MSRKSEPKLSSFQISTSKASPPRTAFARLVTAYTYCSQPLNVASNAGCAEPSSRRGAVKGAKRSVKPSCSPSARARGSGLDNVAVPSGAIAVINTSAALPSGALKPVCPGTTAPTSAEAIWTVRSPAGADRVSVSGTRRIGLGSLWLAFRSNSGRMPLSCSARSIVSNFHVSRSTAGSS